MGDYCLKSGKRQAYDTVAKVPFLVQGPGVKVGDKNNQLVQSVDLQWNQLVQTVSAILTARQKECSVFDDPTEYYRAAAIIELMDDTNPNIYKQFRDFFRNRFWNNTQVAIHVTNGIPEVCSGSNYLIVLWCTGEVELCKQYNRSS